MTFTAHSTNYVAIHDWSQPAKIFCLFIRRSVLVGIRAQCSLFIHSYTNSHKHTRAQTADMKSLQIVCNGNFRYIMMCGSSGRMGMRGEAAIVLSIAKHDQTSSDNGFE